MRNFYLHHDETPVEVSDAHINLMRSYHLWVETVRATGDYPENWEPSDIDIVKSRLFWRIRAGYLPLAWAPPRAYSCPWYEVVEDHGVHSTMECWRPSDADLKDANGEDPWIISQCTYDHINTVSDNEHIVGFGNYRFKIWRDIEAEAARIARLNPHHENLEEKLLEDLKDQLNQGWFIQRQPELEIPQEAFSVSLSFWAKSLQPTIKKPI